MIKLLSFIKTSIEIGLCEPTMRLREIIATRILDLGSKVPESSRIQVFEKEIRSEREQIAKYRIVERLFSNLSENRAVVRGIPYDPEFLQQSANAGKEARRIEAVINKKKPSNLAYVLASYEELADLIDQYSPGI